MKLRPVHQHQRNHARHDEDHVRTDAQPFQQVKRSTHQKGEPPGVPVAVGERVCELKHATREEIDGHHQCQAQVEPPEAELEQRLASLPPGVVGQAAQAENQHGQGEQSKDAEHGPVAMVGRQQGAHFKVRDYGQVDQEPEHACPHEVPEAHGHQKVDGPLVVRGDRAHSGLGVQVAQPFGVRQFR